MRSSKLQMLVCAVIGLSASQFASAEVLGGGFNINPGAMYYTFDSELGLKDEQLPVIGLEYRFLPNIAAEFTYAAADDVDNPNGLPFDFEQLRLDANYYFRPEEKFQPFITAGAGENSYEFGDLGSTLETDETIVDAGIGARYFFNKVLSFRGDVRAVNSLNNETTATAATLSLNLTLGGAMIGGDSESEIEVAETVEAEPQQVAQNDSDMDGVVDANDKCANTDPNVMVDENGCPIQLEQTVSMELDVNFPFDSAQLPEEFYQDVKELATFMKLYEDTIVTVEGHADSMGPEPYNQTLSEQRANKVRELLVGEFGIKPERLKIVGFGETRPVADNATEEGRSQNRRAVTDVTATRLEEQKIPATQDEPAAQ